MTRKEEREQASNLVFKIRLCPKTAFIRGAEWADRHPKEGLWDADKIIEWLQNNAGAYLEDNRKYGEGCEYDTSELIKDLRKAMEK